VQEAQPDYPMSLKDHGPDFALDHRHLWIRMQSQWAILKVRVKVISAVREYLDGNGFFNLDTPILPPPPQKVQQLFSKLNTLMKARPISRKRDNSTTKPISSLLEKSIVSVPPSVRRNQRRVAI
jgi:hypothetical protein